MLGSIQSMNAVWSRSKCNHMHPSMLNMQCSFQFFYDTLFTQTEKNLSLSHAQKQMRKKISAEMKCLDMMNSLLSAL